ncbi:MAG: hypothetical protein HOH74_10325 [Gemmatimonadetes bacterium]|nr:hypothetical protein [Gemmatimonadota bacterium]MBT6145818.1 hypothetical protein [Gemmatimonadota bacterium]
MAERLRVAAIITIYHPKSHADVIVTKFLKGASIDDGRYAFDNLEIVSIYLDHALENDIGLGLAEQFDIPVYPSIRRALHAGGKELGVDAVLLVGEHGDYPWNERGRHMYPRRYFFEQIAGVFSESGRSVPVFNDKHLAYSFADAKWMWDRAAELKIPLMAGSSLPLCWRRPFVDYDKGSVELDEALGISYGSLEAYGYHALETMQCMVERRAGGETGVVSVQCLEGDEVWRARDRGDWSGDLATAALAISEHKTSSNPEDCTDPAVFLIRYADGLKGTVLHLNGITQEFAYAARHKDGRVEGIEFFLQNEGPFAHFGYLCRNVERFFATGIAPYPPQRTLLTTGIIDAVMNSRHEDHRCIDTSQELKISYESYDEMPFRPTGERPSGASIDPQAPDIV